MTHSISPVTRDNPACHGLCCDQRAKCHRYHAIEQSGREGYHVIPMCDVVDGKRSKFISVESTAVCEGFQS